jgi:hypothetical protein
MTRMKTQLTWIYCAMTAAAWALIARLVDGAAWFAPAVGESDWYVKPYTALNGERHTRGQLVTVCPARVMTFHYRDDKQHPWLDRHGTRFPRLYAWRAARFLLADGYAAVNGR